MTFIGDTCQFERVSFCILGVADFLYIICLLIPNGVLYHIVWHEIWQTLATCQEENTGDEDCITATYAFEWGAGKSYDAFDIKPHNWSRS